jgi:uncharacterized protein YebE (UPF0316 family)
MGFIDTLPVWVMAVGIFALRIVDVSLGTLRTLFIVQGRAGVSVAIGFFEVLVWVMAVAQVVSRVADSPALVLAYAGGFATGNACGLWLERRLEIGLCVVRVIAGERAAGIVDALRSKGFLLTTFGGEGRDGPRTLMFTTCQRRELPILKAAIAAIDPTVFVTVDRFSQFGEVGPLPHATGWRGVFKKK